MVTLTWFETRGLASGSGLPHLQGLFGLHPSLSPCVTPLALGRPCKEPNAAPASGQVEVPNIQPISCLDSSLGRVAACGAGGRRFAPRPWHVCLGALLEDRVKSSLSIDQKNYLMSRNLAPQISWCSRSSSWYGHIMLAFTWQTDSNLKEGFFWELEPVFFNVHGAQESIPRNDFRQSIWPGGPVR